MKIKKIICTIMAVILCIGIMGTNASAEVIGDTSVTTSGGNAGQMRIRAAVEKTYRPYYTDGMPTSYYYFVIAEYEYDLAIAERWEMSTTFWYLTDSEVVQKTSLNTNGVYVSKTLNGSAEQYEATTTSATATSEAFGDGTVILNVGY